MGKDAHATVKKQQKQQQKKQKHTHKQVCGWHPRYIMFMSMPFDRLGIYDKRGHVNRSVKQANLALDRA